MRSPNKIVLSRRAVDALPVAEREAVFWDRDLSGFGVRVHTYASRALKLGEGLPIIGRLLGHHRVDTTARYPHHARDSMRESGERITVSSAADIL